MGSVPRLVEALHGRAHDAPERVAYEFVDADGAVSTLTYGDLAGRASALGRALLATGRAHADRPALILFPPGLDYVVAVFACLAARIPAVPAYPPHPWRPEVGLQRLARLVEDSRAGAVLADPLLAPVIELAGAPETLASAIVADVPADGDGPELPARWAADGTDVAFVQYTSGSTRSPRGVVVRHANLEHNVDAIARAFRLGPDSRGFVWLPPYHDMGLVGGILTPLAFGFPVRLMSPLDFLKQPLSWLRQITETRATASGGPNFAYDLCARRRVSDDDLEQLDLSSWSVAFNGAEPVRWQTMDGFAEIFGRAGFRRSAFFPCYGLAEATLIVTGRHWDDTVLRGSSSVPVAEVAREPSRPEAEPARVSCGPPVPGQTLAIVDAASGRALPNGSEGEIWIAGPSVTTGYWGAGRGEEFGELDGVRHLRTGDLGYVVAGELVPSGRLKDVLVLRGVNYHAGDLEHVAVTDVAGLRPVAAAFAVESEREPAAVLVVEARPAAGEADAVAAAVHARVLEATGLSLGAVVVAPPGTIPRTSSGKVQRSLCRERFVAGELEGVVAYRDRRAEAALGANGARPDEDVAGVVVDLVRGVFAAACEADDCGTDETLFELGGDSVRAAEIAGVLETSLDVPIQVEVVLEALTPAAVADRVVELWRARHGDVSLLARRVEELAAPAGA